MVRSNLEVLLDFYRSPKEVDAADAAAMLWVENDALRRAARLVDVNTSEQIMRYLSNTSVSVLVSLEDIKEYSRQNKDNKKHLPLVFVEDDKLFLLNRSTGETREFPPWACFAQLLIVDRESKNAN